MKGLMYKPYLEKQNIIIPKMPKHTFAKYIKPVATNGDKREQDAPNESKEIAKETAADLKADKKVLEKQRILEEKKKQLEKVKNS